VATVIPESVVRVIIPRLKSLGAEGIVEYSLNKIVHYRTLPTTTRAHYQHGIAQKAQKDEDQQA